MLAALPGSPGEAARKAVDGELTLQLPSAGPGPAAPLASPELVRPDGPGPRGPGGRVRLAAWRVPVQAFPPAAALDLLGAVGQLGRLAGERMWPGGSR